MEKLQVISTSYLENTGKKTFRLKEEYLPLYDPYYYVTEKQFTL
jgi:hypothetical protein